MNRQAKHYAEAISRKALPTQYLILDPEHPDEAAILPAAQALKKGELVAFPTETVYGLGANAFDTDAVSAIFLAKGRPADNPLIVHINDVFSLSGLINQNSEIAHALFSAFAPGPLTLVMKKSDRVSDVVTAGLDTVAVRIPSHPVARMLIKMSGVPIAAPSANRSGRPSPTRGWHVASDLQGRVSYILDAGDSVCGLESTVLDISSDQPSILRPGYITRTQINQVLARFNLTCLEHKGTAADRQPVRSPGMKYRHYAPKASVYIADGRHMKAKINEARKLISAALQHKQKAGLFCSQIFLDQLGLAEKPQIIDLYEGKSEIDQFSGNTKLSVICYGPQTDVNAAGAALFAALRLFDAWGAARIIAEGLSAEQEAEAYMNRLGKAASAHKPAADVKKQENTTAKKLLFICTGNTCRSPMAAYLFNKLRTDSSWTANSAGVAAFSGDPISAGARQVLADRYQIDASQHQAKPVTVSLLQEADLVLTMTSQHRDLLQRAFPQDAGKIFSLAEFAGLDGQEISDPFGGPIATYERTASEIEELICRILPKLTRFADF